MQLVEASWRYFQGLSLTNCFEHLYSLNYIIMPEKIIVTMTTWEKRISNIPAVLDTIYSQTSIKINELIIN